MASKDPASNNGTGVHRTYMGGVERGERNLTLTSLEKLAGKMGVDALELLTRSV